MGIKKVFGLALIVFTVDQASKIYVVQYLNLKERLSIDILSPILNFKMAWNKGINFGLLASGSEISRLILVTLLIRNGNVSRRNGIMIGLTWCVIIALIILYEVWKYRNADSNILHKSEWKIVENDSINE